MTDPEPTVEARIADALTLHADDGWGKCRGCGWKIDETVDDDWDAQFVAHQASVVAALPDIAIVELPEQSSLNMWNPLLGYRYAVELTRTDKYPIRHSGEIITNATGARHLAARLLAAARAAGSEA